MPDTKTIADKLGVFSPMYQHIHKNRSRNSMLWRGVPAWKFPADLILYQEVIHENRPDYIVEIGTAAGGSSLFLQDILDLCGGGRVITIDIRDRKKASDSRIEYIIGDSKEKEIVERVRSAVSGKVMVVVDGGHREGQVRQDLCNYGDMVTLGQYLVVEDCYNARGLWRPGSAKNWFLDKNKKFEQTDKCRKYIVSMTMDGWLIRI